MSQLKKKWPFDEAGKLAGQMFGNILHRSADEGGYKHIVEQLNSGKSSVQDIVKLMMTSEEFRELFLMNQTPNEFARILRQTLLREVRPSKEDIKVLAVRLLEVDWRIAVKEIIDSEPYARAFGADKIPLMKRP